MPTLQPEQISDLLNGTLRELGRNKFQNIAQSLVDYEVLPKWFKKDKVQFDEGIGIQRTLLNRFSSAEHVDLFQPDQPDMRDVTAQLQIGWVHARTNWPFIYQEQLMNRGSARIFNIIKARRMAAMIGLAEELETKAWSLPAAGNTVDPLGIPYWIVKNSSTGFNGGAPSGYTTVGGVDLTRSPTFKNYTAQYAVVTKADLVKKLRTAHRLCNFKSPVPGSDYGGNINRYRLYVNESTMSSIEDIGEAQNENLGRDIASMGDNKSQLVFRGHPIIYVAKLDADTTNPVYGIDHSTFMPVCLKGDYLRETVTISPHNHNHHITYLELSYNYLCLDRRRNWVFYV